MVRFSRVGLAVCLMSYPLWRWPLAWRSHREGNMLKDQAYGERMGVSPRNSGECAKFCHLLDAVALRLTPTECLPRLGKLLGSNAMMPSGSPSRSATWPTNTATMADDPR